MSDNVVHAFRTPFGLPPDKGDKPVCGATLTDAYDFPQDADGHQVNRPPCPDCEAIINLRPLPEPGWVYDERCYCEVCEAERQRRARESQENA